MFNLFNTNKRNLKKLQKEIQHILHFSDSHSKLSDEELKTTFQSLKSEDINLDKNLPIVFSLVKEATKRTLGFNTYDVQLIGGIVLHRGNIAEMKTGEGKTLIAVAPACLNALKSTVHVITVNDYLAKRDAETMKPIYDMLGLSVGIVNSETLDRQAEYKKDIVYVTNSEITFDYLKDNLVMEKEEQVLGKRTFAIIDEVDSVLIDEARSPLVISGNVDSHNIELYKKAFNIAQTLEKGEEILDKHGKLEKLTGDFIVELKSKNVSLTEAGITKVEEILDIENLYEKEHVSFSHFITQSLVALNSYEKDVDYILRDEEVLIIDENTGRVSEGRRFSEGLHQAIEVKEGVEPKPESQTIASTSYQNFFKLYNKLSGMTGTAQTEATELFDIYGLDVISIPTNKPIQRKDLHDLIFFSEEEKIEAIVLKVKELNKLGQPILIGTTSIEKSEELHSKFKEANIKHEVLNAKNHAREAEIIELAGQKGAVTIATNMAGRGVDIKVPDECTEVGGLYILGSERHPSRRIDNQLRGRSGRQGDVGATQFYLCLEDDLLVKFGGDKIKSLSKFIKPEHGESIESSVLSRAIEKSQKKIEEFHYEHRKNLLQYDDVTSEQRKVIYDIRQNILEKTFHIEDKVVSYLEEYLIDIEADILTQAEDNPVAIKELINVYMEKKFFLDASEIVDQLQTEGIENEVSNIIKNLLLSNFASNVAIADIPEEEVSQIKRYVLLQILDKEWKEHLHQLDILSTGIGLRGYNQKDPATEYKKEAYEMFTSLMTNIKKEFVETLFKLQINVTEE